VGQAARTVDTDTVYRNTIPASEIFDNHGLGPDMQHRVTS
jgi:hypothetical protein